MLGCKEKIPGVRDDETRFLTQFADDGIGQGFAWLDLAAWEFPVPLRLIRAMLLDKQHLGPVVALNQPDDYFDDRTPGCLAQRSRS
jgi:hypothetical protein